MNHFVCGLASTVCFLVLTAIGPSTPASAAPPVNEGFGARAAGGVGGPELRVTNLDDSGPGSLRAALSTSEPRAVRFAVEGTIELESPLVVTEGRVTLDGETAPGQGVTIRNPGIHFRGDCKWASFPGRRASG